LAFNHLGLFDFWILILFKISCLEFRIWSCRGEPCPYGQALSSHLRYSSLPPMMGRAMISGTS